MAAPFDVKIAQSPAPRPWPMACAAGSVVTNGTVAYRSGGDSLVQLWWFTRAGRRDLAVGAPGPYRQIALSPSGRRVVIQQGIPGFTVGADGDLWLMDLISGIHSRLTSDPTHDADPSWSPDERSVVFTSSRTGRSQLFIKDLATGVEKQLADIPGRVGVDEMTPDGRFVIFRTFGRSVHALPMTGDRTPMLLVDTPAYLEDQSHVSPDGKWIAFNADESGRWEVYVAKFQTFPASARFRTAAACRRCGGATAGVFYFTPRGTMMAVAINPADNAEPAVPHAPSGQFQRLTEVSEPASPRMASGSRGRADEPKRARDDVRASPDPDDPAVGRAALLRACASDSPQRRDVGTDLGQMHGGHHGAGWRNRGVRVDRRGASRRNIHVGQRGPQLSDVNGQ